MIEIIEMSWIVDNDGDHSDDRDDILMEIIEVIEMIVLFSARFCLLLFVYKTGSLLICCSAKGIIF